MRVGKLKHRKAAGMDEVTGEMVKGGDDMMVDWIWRLCNMTFENGVVTEDNLLLLSHSTRLKGRGLNIGIVDALVC